MVNLVLLIVTGLSSVWSRDVGKNYKTLPAVTNSLVNLGKLDISFHFNMHPEDALKSVPMVLESDSLSRSKKDNILEACPCSSIKNMKDSARSGPSNLLNRILSGNDLFTFKEPTSSPLCCSSHEHMQEEIILELGPKENQGLDNSQNFGSSFPLLPHILDLLQNRPSLPSMPMKPKTVEILFFPKKSDVMSKNIGKLREKKKSSFAKQDIVIVGNKEIRNDFKSGAFVPPLPKFTVKYEENIETSSKGEDQVTKIEDKKNTV